jgi:lipopolysaccharide/colanic/teichoic acid biosynthesis glycosyltransferase
MYGKYVKRPLDIFFSLFGLLILSPVLLITALLVRLKLGGPVLFRQPRPGKGERIFTLYKFRTMTDKKDANGALLPDGERLTPFGKILRASSLDELPELWNIVRGDMSVVGPRPLLVEYLPLYDATQKRRHEVRPGLTGLAQVNGRNATTWEERFAYDVKYVDGVRFSTDVGIVFATVGAVFGRKGINAGGSATMERFHG